MTVKPVTNDMVLDVHMYHRERSSEIVSLGEVKPEPDSGSADSPLNCRAKYNCIAVHCSADTVEYEAMQQTSHSCNNVLALECI